VLQFGLYRVKEDLDWSATARLVQRMIVAREEIRYSIMLRLLLMRDAG